MTTVADSPALMLERLAKDPNVGVDKLERLIDMQERIMRFNAEAAFNAAFVKMQPKIPTIIERGATDKTTYAPLEDIIDVVRPILSEFGFTLSHRSEWPEKGMVKVVGILTHQEGHARTSEFLSQADQTGSKNGIQALGSAVQYGKRYTTKDLLCIVTRGQDDDAEKSEKGKQPEAPDGYDPWLATLDGLAEEGFKAFAAAWNKSPEAFRGYLSKTAPKHLAALKTKASKVKA